MQTNLRLVEKTYFFRNRFMHIEHLKNCSLCGDVELFLSARLLAAVDDVDFFIVTFFKWMRWMCSFKLAFRVNFNTQYSHSKIRSFVCTLKWHRSEFLPNFRLHIGHGILSLLQMGHLCNISWKIHSASVCVLHRLSWYEIESKNQY